MLQFYSILSPHKKTLFTITSFVLMTNAGSVSKLNVI